MGKRSHGTHLPSYGRCRWSGIADPLPCHYQCEGKPAGGVDPRIHGPVGGVCRMVALAGTAPACEQPQDSLVDLAGLFRADRRWLAELPGVVGCPLSMQSGRGAASSALRLGATGRGDDIQRLLTLHAVHVEMRDKADDLRTDRSEERRGG